MYMYNCIQVSLSQVCYLLHVICVLSVTRTAVDLSPLT